MDKQIVAVLLNEIQQEKLKYKVNVKCANLPLGYKERSSFSFAGFRPSFSRQLWGCGQIYLDVEQVLKTKQGKVL